MCVCAHCNGKTWSTDASTTTERIEATNHMHVYKVESHTHLQYQAWIHAFHRALCFTVHISRPLIATIPAQTKGQSLLCVTRNMPSHSLFLSLNTHTHPFWVGSGDARKRTSRELLQTCLPQRAVGHSGRQLVDKHLRLHQAHSLVLLRHLERAIITHVDVTRC